MTVLPHIRWLACAAFVTIASAMIADNLAADPKLDLRETEPAKYAITMPDYHHAAREKWRGQVNLLYQQLNSIAEDALKSVADNRLSIDRRTDALMIVEQFSAPVTAKMLIESIELEDERGVHYTDIARGRHPVVTVLKNYGVPVTDHVNFALAQETNPRRRELLCDVLEQVSGVQKALERLDLYLTGSEWKEKEKRNLHMALKELQRRDKPADK